MTAYDQRDAAPSGAAAALTLLIGLAAGAAALLLATPQGKQFLAQFSGRTEDWKASAASALAEQREKMVSAVEAQAPPEPAPPSADGRLRETL